MKHFKVFVMDSWCSACGKTFARKSILDQHRKFVHGKESYVCALCFAEYTRQDSLRRHLRSSHSSVRVCCDECPKTFADRGGLARHKKHVHKNTFYECHYCYRRFSRRELLQTHIHKDVSLLKKKCPVCGFLGSKCKIMRHFMDVHNIRVEREILNFKTENEFLTWKENLERDEVCSYVLKFSLRSDKFRLIYICHRDGFYRPEGCGKRNIKLIGSNKINGHCPSRIVVDKINDLYCVEYFKTHVGHQKELERLKLKKEDRESVALKLSLKIPFETILNEVKEKNDRLNLLTKKDLYNLQSSFHIKHNKQKRANEEKPTKSIVEFYEEMPQQLVLESYEESDDKGVVVDSNLAERKDELLLTLSNLNEIIRETENERVLDLIKNYLTPLQAELETEIMSNGIPPIVEYIIMPDEIVNNEFVE